MPLSEFDRNNLGRLILGDGDWFTARLLQLIHKSDAWNRARLRLAFPEEVAAYEEWSKEGMWITKDE